MPTPAVEYITYRQSSKTFTPLRRMVGGQSVKVATTYTEYDANILKEAFTNAQPHTG